MVCLGHQQLRALNPPAHLLRHVAQIGSHRQLPLSGADGIAVALVGVVRGWKGLNLQALQPEALPRGEGVEHLLQKGNPVAQLPGGPPAGIDRQGQLLGQGSQPGHMVGVFMGNQHGGQRLRRHPKSLQGGGDPPAGNARVHQNMGGAVAHQQAVAAGAAGQGAKFQHKLAPSHKKQAGALPRLGDGSFLFQPTWLCFSSSGVTTTRISAPTPESLRTMSS